jgi:hypothetical protein
MARGLDGRGRFPVRAVAAAASIVVVAGLLALLPPIRARAKAAGVLAEALGLPLPRPFAAPVRRGEVRLEGVLGDLYVPGRPAPPVLLLPGAAPRGREDPRAVRLAFALARAGRAVFVPELELYDQTFTERDLDRIARAVVGLDDLGVSRGGVQIVGISYGGSFGLVAAADPRVRDRLVQVAVFGAYWDLVGVIQGVTTGVSLVDGRRYPWAAHPRADEILQRVALHLVSKGSRPELRMALDGSRPGRSLPSDARALHALMVNRDPDRTFELAAPLDPSDRGVLRRFSPSSVGDRIEAPVVAMHSVDDPAVPFGEAVRLSRALPGSRLVEVRLFRHVDLRSDSTEEVLGVMGDLLRAWRFATWVVGAQE